jgi:hypothetical protein
MDLMPKNRADSFFSGLLLQKWNDKRYFCVLWLDCSIKRVDERKEGSAEFA